MLRPGSACFQAKNPNYTLPVRMIFLPLLTEISWKICMKLALSKSRHRGQPFTLWVLLLHQYVGKKRARVCFALRTCRPHSFSSLLLSATSTEEGGSLFVKFSSLYISDQDVFPMFSIETLIPFTKPLCSPNVLKGNKRRAGLFCFPPCSKATRRQ